VSVESALPPGSLFRRCGAILYDALVLTAVLIVATVPMLPLMHGKVLVPGEVGWTAYAYRAWLWIVMALFLSFFWTRSGQTLGMLPWRLRLEYTDGSLLNWRGAILRVVLVTALWLPYLVGYGLLLHQLHGGVRTSVLCLSLAPAIISLLWILIDREHRTLIDRWMGTRMVVVPKAGAG
jgi:uncharacterized RDD family membrane protein YckC